MATYLSLTNELLREMNEVALTSSTFANAIGVQQHVKDIVNRAYFDIVNEELSAWWSLGRNSSFGYYFHNGKHCWHVRLFGPLFGGIKT